MSDYICLIILGSVKDAWLGANLRGVRLRSIEQHPINWSQQGSKKTQLVPGVVALTDAAPSVLDAWLREGLKRKPEPGDLLAWDTGVPVAGKGD